MLEGIAIRWGMVCGDVNWFSDDGSKGTLSVAGTLDSPFVVFIYKKGFKSHNHSRWSNKFKCMIFFSAIQSAHSITHLVNLC
jgi:hypothetical protein